MPAAGEPRSTANVVSPSAGLVVRPRPWFSVFATYTRGFEPPAPGQYLEDGRGLEPAKHESIEGGLGDPLLVATDGAPGLIRAVEECFPRSARARGLAHRMRNLQSKVPEGEWPKFREKAKAAYQAPSREVARMLRDVLVEEYEKRFPAAVKCFLDDFEACIAHLRFPIAHRRVIRTTNLLERLFGQERRRMKIVANAFGERAVLKLMNAALIRASESWRGIAIKPLERSYRSLAKSSTPSIGRLASPRPVPKIQQDSDLTLDLRSPGRGGLGLVWGTLAPRGPPPTPAVRVEASP